MDIRCISQLVSDCILTQPDIPTQEGAAPDCVTQHVLSHMLHPRVRLAVMLRQLLDLTNLLQNNIVIRDGGSVTVDKAIAELYLKVIGQVMALYKSDTTGMLFTEEDNNTAAGAAAKR